VQLMARAGLRRGELCGLRHGDVHLLANLPALGSEVGRAHLHVVRRDNSNGRGPRRAGSGRCRWISLSCRHLTPTSLNACGSDRRRPAISCSSTCSASRSGSDAPDAIGKLLAAASRRAGLASRMPRTSCGMPAAAIS
jgi:integrase/recombinase XerD